MASPAPAARRRPISLPPSNLLRRISAICGAVYLLTTPWHPYAGSAIIKGLSIALLGWIALRSHAILLGVALGFSSLGDVLLDVDSRNLFVYGLGAFLIAHVNYTVLFLRGRSRQRTFSKARLELIGVVLIYAFGFAAWLVPSLGRLAVPVALYMGAITAMVVSSITARFETRRAAAGAILFLVSDSILAADKFRMAIPLRDYLVWMTYYAAQYFIAMGVLDKPDAEQ